MDIYITILLTILIICILSTYVYLPFVTVTGGNFNKCNSQPKINFDKLKIFRTEDYGPITKLYPTVERITNPDTIIVVADDDLIYHPEMLVEQVKNQYKFEI